MAQLFSNDFHIGMHCVSSSTMTDFIEGSADPIDGKLMMIIAVIGMIFNVVSAPSQR